MSSTVEKILILTANPTNTKPLRLSEEVREIKTAWERSQRRNQFEIIVEEAVRPRELRLSLLEHKPDIVHFSGHGGGEHGLVFMRDDGEALLVKPDALARLFKALKEIFKIKCVLLNACYSEVQAEKIYLYVDYVVGMKKKIGDEAAKQFAMGFYDTLFAGESINSAYALGCNAIEMEDIPEYLTPVIKKSIEKTHIRYKTEKVSILPSETAQDRAESTIKFDDIDSQVPLNSTFYIEHPSIVSNCYSSILKPGALIRIKSPRKMGKTSLMSRILAHAAKQGYKTAFLNLWDTDFLTSIDKFLQWFCASLSEELDVEEKIDKHWKKILGSQKNCTNYFRKHLLKEISTPIVLGLDDVDQIFQYTAIAEEFFKLLRAWHERGQNEEIWKKMRLIIAHSKEVYINMDANHSPFNVGLSIELGEFSQAQVKDLVKRHRLNWSDIEIEQLMKMVSGHPYLLRAALYQIATEQVTLEQFLQIAPTEEGLYADHLYCHFLVLEANDSLKSAMQQVVASDFPVRLEPVQAFKLRSMGLVVSRGNEVVPLCNLYRLYFRDRLEN
ncbi:MAG: CHAT domain-containing protein [Symploca sp. SIO1C2]|nr:CHAT domain-containing protein [Symploca sp. SIO1C2]